MNISIKIETANSIKNEGLQGLDDIASRKKIARQTRLLHRINGIAQNLRDKE